MLRKMLKGPHYPVAYSMRHITLIHLKKSGNLNLFHAFVKSSTVCRSELVISIPNGPLKLVVRSIFVQVPTLNSHHRAHDPDTIVLSNSPNRYFTCTSLQNAFFSKHFFSLNAAMTATCFSSVWTVTPRELQSLQLCCTGGTFSFRLENEHSQVPAVYLERKTNLC